MQAERLISQDARLVEVGRGALLARKVAALGASALEVNHQSNLFYILVVP